MHVDDVTRRWITVYAVLRCEEVYNDIAGDGEFRRPWRENREDTQLSKALRQDSALKEMIEQAALRAISLSRDHTRYARAADPYLKILRRRETRDVPPGLVFAACLSRVRHIVGAKKSSPGQRPSGAMLESWTVPRGIGSPEQDMPADGDDLFTLVSWFVRTAEKRDKPQEIDLAMGRLVESWHLHRREADQDESAEPDRPGVCVEEGEAQVVIAGQRGRHNDDYYEQMLESMRSIASGENKDEEMVIIGSGFELADSKGVHRAYEFLEAMTGVALRGRLYRVDLSTPPRHDDGGMREWMRLVLLSLVHMKRTTLYTLKPGADPAMLIRDLAVFRPGHHNSTVEIGFPMPSDSDDPGSSRLMDFALFARHDEFGSAVSQIIKRWVRRRDSGVHVVTKGRKVYHDRVAEVKEYYRIVDAHERADEKVLMFSYGSNCLEEQLRDRVQFCEFAGIGYMLDRKLDFKLPGGVHDGNVASAEPAQGEKLFGALWWVTRRELERMDIYEGVKIGRYERKKVKLRQLVGSSPSEADREVEARVYVGCLERRDGIPTPDYLDRILSGIEELFSRKKGVDVKLVKDYIADIKKRATQ